MITTEVPAESYTWICAYPGCGSVDDLVEHPIRPPHDLNHIVPARVGSACWSFAPEGWRRVHYCWARSPNQQIRVLCPDHAHIAGYGGRLDQPALDAMEVLDALLHD